MATKTQERGQATEAEEAQGREHGPHMRGHERQEGGGRAAKSTRGRHGGDAYRGATPQEVHWMEKHRDKLSKTTLRAKWVHSPDEQPDRPGQTLATRDHTVIQAWAEERGAQPATVRARQGDRPRVLRFDFAAGGANQRLEPISWDDWFRVFNARDLVMLFQQTKRDGQQSNFFRLDSPKREDA